MYERYLKNRQRNWTDRRLGERERDNLGIKVKMFEEEERVRLFGSLSLVECVFGWSWLYETQSYCPIISSRVAMTMRSFMLHYS